VGGGGNAHDRHCDCEALARRGDGCQNQSVKVLERHEDKVLAQCAHHREHGNLFLKLKIARVHEERNALLVLAVCHNRDLPSIDPRVCGTTMGEHFARHA
jgi:hypothetical protein